MEEDRRQEVTEKLKPCPYCGKRPFKETRIICSGTTKREKRIICYCCDYARTGWKYHYEDAVRDWNNEIEIHLN